MVWDFATILFLLVVISGCIWLIDSLFFGKKREKRQAALPPAATVEEIEQAARLPVLVDYARSFFPIFLIVLILRSFLVEPFRIPSGSMIPTLLVGDFILVNKYTYGIRLPVINRKIVELGRPERGDVVVFRYPVDPSTPFIKRVIGLPGDEVRYNDKSVFINGNKIVHVPEGTYVGVRSAAHHTGAQLLGEELDEKTHNIIVTRGTRGLNGVYQVPENHYFVLGDNRDNSRDSRYWGYVPDSNLVGRAFFIWMSWDSGPKFNRIGTAIH